MRNIFGGKSGATDPFLSKSLPVYQYARTPGAARVDRLPPVVASKQHTHLVAMKGFATADDGENDVLVGVPAKEGQ